MTTNNNGSNSNLVENRHLCFSLGKEKFGIPLLQVKEVLGVPEFTRIPFVPSYFCGVMNLRGKVISVVDLKKKFNIQSKGIEEKSVIVCQADQITMGILVDSVDVVIRVESDNILQKPDIQSEVKSDYIHGMFHYKNEIIILINLIKSLSIEDIIKIKNQELERG